MTVIGPDTDLDTVVDVETLPAPGTDEGWAALAAEAARHGYGDPQAYVAAYGAAYAAGHVNVGFAGYRPGDPHTGFGQVQAFDQAAGGAGVPLEQYAAMHTPEALAEARGEGGPPPDAEPDDLAALGEEAARHGFDSVEEYVRDCAQNGYNTGIGGGTGASSGHDAYERFAQDARDAGRSPSEFLADRTTTPDEHVEPQFSPPANFTADGIPIEYGPDGIGVVPNIGVTSLPDGVDHYDRYTGEPLDAQGHVVLGVPNAGDGHEFTTALDQRIGLDEHGRIDPDEIDRLETAAREHGDATVGDLVAATSRPFPGHSLSDTGAYARPVVLPGQPPIAYSGPDGSFIIAGDGTVLTAEPGRELSYEGEHGSALVGTDGRVITTDEDGHITVTEPQVEYEEVVWTESPVDDVHVFDEAVEPGSVPEDGDWITNEYHDLDGEATIPVDEAQPAPGRLDPEPTFGQGDVSTGDVPDSRVTTTAEDLGSSSGDRPGEDSPSDVLEEQTADETGGDPADTSTAPDDAGSAGHGSEPEPEHEAEPEADLEPA